MFRGKRHRMKQKEKDIDTERERERKLERGTAQDDPISEIIEHFSHPHQLIYTEPKYVRFCCDSCTITGYGKRYHCALCNFDLHKNCAQSPITRLLPHMPPDEMEAFGVRFDTIDTLAHPQHPVVAVYKNRSYICNHCNNLGNGLRFHCDVCDIWLHQVCAKNPTRLTTNLHPEHELELKLRPLFKRCDLCKTGRTGHLNNFLYRSIDSQFYLHPRCSEWPLYLVHPLHPPHPLVLKPCDIDYICFSCKGHMTRYKYSCNLCGLHFDPGCILEKAKLDLGDEVLQKYTGEQITVLPTRNLSMPERAYECQSVPPQTPFSNGQLVVGAIAISMIAST